jgi:hypothetical protein
MGKLADPTYCAPISSAMVFSVVFWIFIEARFRIIAQKYKKSAKSQNSALFNCIYLKPNNSETIRNSFSDTSDSFG